MDDYRGRFRPVVVFAQHDREDRLLRQRAVFAAAVDGFSERDVVLIEVVGDGVVTMLGPECQRTASDVRAHCGIAVDRFNVVLVGKDGGVKLRSDEPVRPADLFALIDAMPMRQQEMRGRGRARR